MLPAAISKALPWDAYLRPQVHGAQLGWEKMFHLSPMSPN